MIRRVYEQASKSKSLSAVVVATDNTEIFDHVKSFGGQVSMTREDHASGTDRCYETLTQQTDTFAYVINIQGDEPFIQPTQIDLLASRLNGQTEIATLVKAIHEQETLFNPNVVKAVISARHEALYFSRATLPHIRLTPEEQWLQRHTFYKHIGMYAYRADILKQITQLPISTLEKAESLEQLRWLENGYRIAVAETTEETIGVDTPEDIVRAQTLLGRD